MQFKYYIIIMLKLHNQFLNSWSKYVCNSSYHKKIVLSVRWSVHLSVRLSVRAHIRCLWGRSHTSTQKNPIHSVSVPHKSFVPYVVLLLFVFWKQWKYHIWSKCGNVRPSGFVCLDHNSDISQWNLKIISHMHSSSSVGAACARIRSVPQRSRSHFEVKSQNWLKFSLSGP